MAEAGAPDEEQLLLEAEFQPVGFEDHGEWLAPPDPELATGWADDDERRPVPPWLAPLGRVIDRLAAHPREAVIKTVAGAGAGYLVVSLVMWWHVWTGHPSATATCECGDPSLFIWFLKWPAYALVHGRNPFFSTAMFHGTGINLLSNTSVLGLGVPLIPVTLLFGPVASLNVALTLAPVLSAGACFWLVRRWAPWTPAAFVAGLLYGFSPFVLENLAYAHLMTAALFIPPLVVGCLDDLVRRHRHRPRRVGIVLALLLIEEFFISTEVLCIMGISLAIGLVLLAAYARLVDRPALVAAWPAAVTGLGTAAVVSAVVLAVPTWYALLGPQHFTGPVWPDLPQLAGYSVGNYLHTGTTPGVPSTPFDQILGYLGRPLPSSGYVGYGLPLVLAGGLAVWWRDRRLWFFGANVVVATVITLGGGTNGPSVWAPLQHLPLLENIIQQRFIIMGLLAAAVMLGIIIERTHAEVVARLRHGHTRHSHARRGRARAAGRGAALAVAAVALGPIIAASATILPMAVEPTFVPAWYRQEAPHLGLSRVVLTYPMPSSGVQSAMTWQALTDMPVSIAGGGGPEALPSRAGPDAPALLTLTNLAVGLVAEVPTRSALADVRRSLHRWGVTDVVISGADGQSDLDVGKPPSYAAGYMTAALGRLPMFQDDAWVWDGVTRLSPALAVPTKALWHCYTRSQRHQPQGVMTVPDCVLAADRSRAAPSAH